MRSGSRSAQGWARRWLACRTNFPPAASRPKQKSGADFVNQFVSWGAGTRAGQYLVLGAKARALLQGRAHVTEDDIRALALPVLRHRILVNYRAEAEGVTVGNIVERLLTARG